MGTHGIGHPGHVVPPTLDIRRVTEEPGDDWRLLRVETDRGLVLARFYPGDGSPHGTLWVGEGLQPFDSPGDQLYATLARELQALGVASLHVQPRYPGERDEVSLDLLLGASLLQQRAVVAIALVAHGASGPAAVLAAAASDAFVALALLSSPVAGAEHIGEVAPRPTLIVHGAKDDLVPVAAAHRLYAMAGEPRRLVLLERAGHALAEAGELPRTLLQWLTRHLLGSP
ncbi:MAG TPA: alpha/beta hydrolase [Chloroflexota bacterium]